MKLDKVANSHNDEFYTPLYAIKPILEFIPPSVKVWCPFDTEQSLFVKELSKTNEVVYSSLLNGQNFFEIEVPENTKYIISNPPYSLKTEVLERLFKFDIPFAMLLGIVGLFESKKRFEMFRDNEFEIMYFNKRVAYFKDYNEQKPSLNPPFSSVYICHNMLPKKIMFKEIDKK
ncbi:hypothetical protein CB473P3_00058 [Enterocloster phage CB473P3]|nr:hypothetical protein CB473P3_00058 [Enterocloster phage CB473P3]